MDLVLEWTFLVGPDEIVGFLTYFLMRYWMPALVGNLQLPQNFDAKRDFVSELLEYVAPDCWELAAAAEWSWKCVQYFLPYLDVNLP